MQDDVRSPESAKTKKADSKPAHNPLQRNFSLSPTSESSKAHADVPQAKEPKAKKGHFSWWRRLNRNLRFAIIALLLLAFGAGAVFFYRHNRPVANPVATITNHSVQSTTVASPLTGVQVDPALAARPVTGVMIENSDFARPQSGLQDAGVVYEAIAEGGVTRFLALFQDSAPQYIGPVRSLRPYYIDFAAPFQASMVHVGGSASALREVSSGGFRNLDEFANGGYFQRITSRFAPHNVYTSFKQLDKLNRAKGYRSSTFTSWPRKADSKRAVPTATNIKLAISGPDFYATYTYDPKTNTYPRSEGGEKHLEIVSPKTGKEVRLHPKVVIALVLPLGQGKLDATGAYYSDYSDTGSGRMYIFQDGGVIKGTWSKTDTKNQFKFTSGAGNPIKLNAGQTWITVVSSPTQVSYQK